MAINIGDKEISKIYFGDKLIIDANKVNGVGLITGSTEIISEFRLSYIDNVQDKTISITYTGYIVDSLPDTLNLGSCLNVADLTSILSGKTIKSISMSANLVGGSNTVLCRISPDTNYLQMKNLSLQAQVVTYAPMHYGKMAEIYYE